MDIKVYAAILLVARVISMGFTGAVVLMQLGLFKLPIEGEDGMTTDRRRRIRSYRKVLFGLAVAAFVSNIIPTVIDILTIFDMLERSSRVVQPASLVYTMTWAGSSILTSILLWSLYYMSYIVDRKNRGK